MGRHQALVRAPARHGRPPVDATKLVPLTFVVVVLLVGMGGVLFLADVFNPVQLL